MQNFSLFKLLPDTRGYITYEGSLTEPGCQETVTWIIMNRPIYITPQQVFLERIRLIFRLKETFIKLDIFRDILYHNRFIIAKQFTKISARRNV